MRVFVTGSSGWIGSATVDELLGAGHQVVGLVRSAESAARIAAKGAQAWLGNLDDLESLRRGAESADAVIHLANKHDWADQAGNDRTERAAVAAMLESIAGTGKAFAIANGLSGIVAGRPVLETDASPAIGPASDRGGSENLALDAAGRGIRPMAVRFAPSVHGHKDWGFVTFLVAAARERGVSGYVGDGSTTWSAVHVADAARLIRLGVESAPAGSRLHAIAEPSISTKAIAEAIGTALALPVTAIDPDDAASHFGVVGHFFGQTLAGSSTATRALLAWSPTGPTLVEDILGGAYTAA